MVTLGFLVGMKRNMLSKVRPAMSAPTIKRPELLHDSVVLGVGHLEEANAKPDYQLATKALLFGTGVVLSAFGAAAALTCYALDIKSVSYRPTAPRVLVRLHLGKLSFGKLIVRVALLLPNRRHVGLCTA